MNAVLVWKVYREQRWVWLAMALLAVAAVVLRLTLLQRDLQREAVSQLFCLFAYVYGLVVGAVLLAGEREAGTATFLEVLPVKRLTVWWAKCRAGLTLVLVQVGFLWLLLLDEILRNWDWGLMLLGALVAVGILGFAWGLFFSGRTKTSMGAILAAVLAQLVVTPLTRIVADAVVELMRVPLNSPLEAVAPVLCYLPVVVGLLFGAGATEAWRDQRAQVDDRRMRAGDFPPPYDPVNSALELEAARILLDEDVPARANPHQPDTEPRREDSWLVPPRQPPSVSPAQPAPEPAVDTMQPGWVRQLTAVFWLELRQAGKLFLWLAGAGLVAGCLPLWVLGWPVLTLLLGVIAGVSVFAGEQIQASGRFLAEQRLPRGRIWAIKVGARLALALGVVQLMLLPAAIQLAFREVQEGGGSVEAPTEMHLLAPYVQMGPYLTLGLVHGFSVGCLCGLLFRKPVIAGAIAVSASLLLLALWLPSLVVGGLHAWQYWGLPVLLLLTVRLLVWPWATGRLGSRSAVVSLVSGLVLAVLWFVAALGYRVIEVPLVEDRLDLAGFERNLEDARKTETGLHVRTILNQIPKLHQDGWGEGWSALWVLGVPYAGWPANAPWLSSWLDEFFRLPWCGQLAKAVRQPLGVVEDVQSMHPEDHQTPMPPKWLAIGHGQRVAQVLVARGLQLQARGDHAAFLDHLETGLALVRQVRHLEPSTLHSYTTFPERELLSGGERWLERLDGRPDLLRRALDLLREHEQATVKEVDNALHVEYLIAVNAVKRPESWACEVVRFHRANGTVLVGLTAGGKRTTPWKPEPSSEADANVLAVLTAAAWRTPWEEARLQRLIRQLANEGAVAFPLPPPLTRQVLFPGSQPQNRFNYAALKDTTAVQIRELMVALRLFQAEAGRPAKTLEELTPNILPAVPVEHATGAVVAYQLDGRDKGPARAGAAPSGQGILILKGERFLVPLPPRK